MSFTRLGVHCERVRMVNSTLRGFYHDCKHHGSQYVFSLHGKMPPPGRTLGSAPWVPRGGGEVWAGVGGIGGKRSGACCRSPKSGES